jgi:hypothetical protein
MPQPAQSSAGKTLPIFVGGLAIVVAVLLFWGLRARDFAGLERLPIDGYVNKPGDFLGNTYAITAQIDSQVKWEKGVGRILVVRPERSVVRLPVYVPDGVSENLHIGQRYKMRARIEQGGLIYVEDLRKY